MSHSKLGVVIGHSHIGAVVHAIAARPAETEGSALHVALYETWKFNGVPPFLIGPEGAQTFDGAILAPLDALPGADDRAYFTLFGGNAHSVLALMRHSRPYDFVLPEAPDLPLADDAERVPLAYVETFLQTLMDPYLHQLYCLRLVTDAPVFAFEPPPVNPDDAYVIARLDDFFVQNSDIRALAPASLRLKMHRLQCRLLAALCERNGITVIPVPPAAMTPDGYLDPSCYGPDATHAGGPYGELLLRQIEQRCGTAMRTWSAFS